MSPNRTNIPDWDVEQIEVILDTPASWQLVIAGPGAGKSAVACQRIAYLIDESVPPARILLVSFTRTAVAELRDRIVSYALAGIAARSVRISTIDSNAWSLRNGFDESSPVSLGNDSYELNIERTVELFKKRNPELLDFMDRLEHLIVDEAQDVMSSRAELILQMLCSLSPTCGVTILADPAQAIYGFTNENSDDTTRQKSLLERLPIECPRPLLKRTLNNIHRVKDGALVELFLRTRKEVELAEEPSRHIARVQQTIREACGNNIGVTSFESLPDLLKHAQDPSMLVLFRRRADVLFASSYCSNAGVEHRIRMSDLPVVVRPWLGWLLGETVIATLDREGFDKLWELRGAVCSAPFVGESRDDNWTLLHRIAAGSRPNTLDLVQLRDVVSRPRPPIELCYSELGTAGPILSTIHASKGREADSVVLVMPPHWRGEDRTRTDIDNTAAFEEGRVYYVGATRARKTLTTAENSAMSVRYLESGRVFRIYGEKKAQMEIGRDGDVDKLAHLAWSHSLDAQHMLAAKVGSIVPVQARALAEEQYALRIVLEHKGRDGVTKVCEVGQFSTEFRAELGKLWSKVDENSTLKPVQTIPHLYLIAVGTVGISEQERSAVKPPFRQSAFALSPVVKGFPMIHFLYRRHGRFV